MTKDAIRSIQTGLSDLGYDIGKAGADGLYGGDTRRAAQAWLDNGGKAAPAPVPTVALSFPAASEAKLKGVNEALADVVREAYSQCPVPFAVIEGLRTKERQAQLVKQGASKTMNSYHLTGHAVDLWPVDPATGKNLPSDAAFKRGSAEAKAADKALWDGLRKIAKTMKAVAAQRGVPLTWGGDWATFPDAPHFQTQR